MTLDRLLPDLGPRGSVRPTEQMDKGLPIPCAVPSRLPEAASEDRWDEAAGLPLDVVAYIAPHDPGADGTVAILP